MGDLLQHRRRQPRASLEIASSNRQRKVIRYRWREASHPCVHQCWELIDTRTGRVLLSINPQDLGPPQGSDDAL
ncbi:MAG: hypothetical protein U0136_05470 [Bdellovibrionota bacterium]